MTGPEQPDHEVTHHRRIRFFGTPVDLLTLDETLAIAETAMATRVPVRHTALNVAKLVKISEDRELEADVHGSDLIGIDGQGIVYGLALFGQRGTTRVAGIDLFFALLGHCAKTGRRPFFLGARQEILDRAIRIAQDRWPGLQIAGARNGYFTAEEEPELVAQIARSRADCLFVAMPTPRKERFLNRYCQELDIPFTMGVGGSVDVLAGQVSRAPQWMQRMGLEWFHRLLKEPSKMFWRYTRTNSFYAWMLLRAFLTSKSPVEQR